MLMHELHCNCSEPKRHELLQAPSAAGLLAAVPVLSQAAPHATAAAPPPRALGGHWPHGAPHAAATARERRRRRDTSPDASGEPSLGGARSCVRTGGQERGAATEELVAAMLADYAAMLRCCPASRRAAGQRR
jgi:hypothetical protein